MDRIVVCTKADIDMISERVNQDMKDENKRLKKEGWKVIRLWEHELKGKSINKTITKVTNKIKKKEY